MIVLLDGRSQENLYKTAFKMKFASQINKTIRYSLRATKLWQWQLNPSQKKNQLRKTKIPADLKLASYKLGSGMREMEL